MLLVLTMFMLGTLFGFIGAGGAGFVIAVLTVFLACLSIWHRAHHFLQWFSPAFQERTVITGKETQM